MITHVDLVFHS